MSLREKAIRGILWSAVQNWGSSLISLVVFLVLARLLEPKAFGLVAMASAFIAFLEVFLRQGFGQAIIQRADLRPAHLDTAFWISVLLGVILTAFGIAAAALVADVFGRGELAPIIRWLSLSFLIGGLSNTQRTILQRNLAFKSLAVRALVGAVAGGCVGIGMAVAGYGVWSLVGQSLAGNLVGLAVLWRASDWRPGIQVSTTRFRELFGFGANVMGIEVLGFLNRRAGDLIIGYFLGPVALGFYTIASGLVVRIMHMLTLTVSPVAFPVFSRLQHAPGQIRHAFYTTTQMSSLITFPAFLGISALAPELVRGLFGARWEPSIPVMQVLAFLGVVHFVSFFSLRLVTACGKPSWALGLSGLNAVATLVVFLVVARWGIVVLAVAFVIASYVIAPVAPWVVHKLIRIDPLVYLRQCIAPLVGSLVMVAVLLLAKPWLRDSLSVQVMLAVEVLVGAAVYTGVLLLIAPALLGRVLDMFRVAVSPETSSRA